jgi:hypothetical protein
LWPRRIDQLLDGVEESFSRRITRRTAGTNAL